MQFFLPGFLSFVLLLAAGTASSQVTLKKIAVADHYGPCKGDVHTKCLLTRDSGNGHWSSLPGHIEGFHYEEGYAYQLMVEEHQVQASPGEAIYVQYTLSKVISRNKKKIAPGYRLDDQPWFLVKIKNGQQLQDIKTSHAFIVFHTGESRISGNGGCNRFSGSMEMDTAHLSISKVSATKMMCQGTMSEVEKMFLGELPKANRYKVKGKQLFLYHDKIPLLIFRKK